MTLFKEIEYPLNKRDRIFGHSLNALSYKNALYCWSRFLSHTFFNFFLISIFAVLVKKIISNGEFVIPEISELFLLKNSLLPLFLMFFAIQASFTEVFFKPYKCFSLLPKFKKTPGKLVFLFLFIGFLVSVLIVKFTHKISDIIAFYTGNNILGIQFWFIITGVFLVIASFLIVKVFVEEYAEIIVVPKLTKN